MMSSADIELMVDVRRLGQTPKRAEDLILLWERTQNAIIGRTLAQGDTRPVDFPGNGQLQFTVIGTSTPHVTVSEKTVIAIHSVIEPASVRHRCRLCAAVGKNVDGPFSCRECSKTDEKSGVCEEHVSILEAGLRRAGNIVSTCIEHLPKCNHCHQGAAFWCLGPICKGQHAWCKQQRKTHRNNPDNPYCPSCYERVYPQCGLPNCLEPGTSQCEHVDPGSGVVCGRRLCNRHVARWQVYGYERIGLARCSDHRRILELSDSSVMWQVVAGTALRRSGGRAMGMRVGSQHQIYPLPSLGSIKNILLKGRKKFYTEEIAMRLYEELQEQLRATSHTSPLQLRMLDLLERSASKWIEMKDRAGKRRDQGLSYLLNLKSAVAAAGLGEMISALEMTDFLPESTKPPARKACLFIRLPEQHRGRFIGRDGSRIREFSLRIGCDIRFEKGQ